MAENGLNGFGARFENWRRWCFANGRHVGRAGSAEGGWRSPQHWYPEDPRPPAIDVPDAVLVNQAFTSLALLAPRQARIIKIITFRPYLRPQYQAQKLGIHYLQLGEAYHRAKLALAARLSD